jgi:hypothetical protein
MQEVGQVAGQEVGKRHVRGTCQPMTETIITLPETILKEELHRHNVAINTVNIFVI